MLRIAKKADHRPADPRAARKLVSELQAGDAARALEQIIAWLETLTALPEVRLDRRFESIAIFEEAAMPFEKRITRDYVRSGRLQSSQEQRLWATAHDFWHQLGYCRLRSRCLSTPRVCRIGRDTQPADGTEQREGFYDSLRGKPILRRNSQTKTRGKMILPPRSYLTARKKL